MNHLRAIDIFVVYSNALAVAIVAAACTAGALLFRLPAPHTQPQPSRHVVAQMSYHRVSPTVIWHTESGEGFVTVKLIKTVEAP